MINMEMELEYQWQQAKLQLLQVQAAASDKQLQRSWRAEDFLLCWLRAGKTALWN